MDRTQHFLRSNTSDGRRSAAASTPEQVLIWIIPLKGLDPNSPIDANVTHINAGNGTSMTTGTSGIFSSVPKEMIWGIFLEDNYSTPYAPESGFTNLSGQEAVSLLEYKNVTQTGIQSATGTNGNGSNNWIGAVIGLKMAGQSGGITPTLSSIAVTPANPSIVSGRDATVHRYRNVQRRQHPEFDRLGDVDFVKYRRSDDQWVWAGNRRERGQHHDSRRHWPRSLVPPA